MSGNSYRPKMTTAANQQVPAASIYDRELEKIYSVMAQINEKYSKKLLDDNIVKQMQVETQNRFADIGFRVQAGVDPNTRLFTFDIIGRTEKHEFDPEEKQWEVKKAKKENKIIREL